MSETTSTLFQKLRGRESGRDLLQKAEAEPSCAQTLQTLLEGAGLSAPEWMAAADISKSYGYQILRGSGCRGGTSCCARPYSLHCR